MITVYLGNSKKILLLLQSGEDKAWGGPHCNIPILLKRKSTFFIWVDSDWTRRNGFKQKEISFRYQGEVFF